MILTKIYTKKRYLIAVLIFFVALIGVAGPYSGKLADVQTNDNLQFLPESAEATKVAELQAKTQQTGQIPALVLLTTNDGTPMNPAVVKGFQEQIQDVEHVVSVAGPIPSEDGQALLYIAAIDTSDTEQTSETLQELQNLPPPNPNVTVSIAGPAAFLADLTEAFEGIDGLLLLVALVVVAIILLVVYRSPFLPLIVLFTSVSALAVASLAVYEMAKAGWIVLNGQAQGILFILVVGATTDYSLLLVSRVRENLAAGESKTVAALNALKKVFEPVVASAATVAAAVMVLTLSDLKANAALGPVAAVGIVAAAVLALGMLPTILALGGKRLYWPNTPKPAVKDGYWTKLAGKVERNPRRSWLIPTILLAVLVPIGFTMPATGVSTQDFFTTEVSSSKANEKLAEHYPAGLGSETVVVAPAESAGAVESALNSAEGVADVQPGQPIVDGTAAWAVWNVTLSDEADSKQAETTVKTLRETLPAEALVGGSTAVTVDTNSISLRDATIIMPLILVVIFVILVLLLRAAAGPVILIASVALSFGATYAVGAIVFKLLGHPGVDPSVPLFAFVFLAALGVDYNIFLATRAREETLASNNPRRGMIVALAATGAVITSAGLVLAATFAALAVLPLLFLLQIAFLVSFGVLLDTFIVRTLIVPGAFYEMGWKAWWPTKPKPVESIPEKSLAPDAE